MILAYPYAYSFPYVPPPLYHPEARRPLMTAYDEDGSDMNGSRLTVQFARGSRQRDFPAPDRTHPRPRRTAYRMQISGLPGETSWQVSSLLHYVCSWLLVRGSMDRARWAPSVSVAPLESPLVALSSFALLPFSLHPMRMTVASLDSCVGLNWPRPSQIGPRIG